MGKINFNLRSYALRAVGLLSFMVATPLASSLHAQVVYGTVPGDNERNFGMIYSVDLNKATPGIDVEFSFPSDGKLGTSPSVSLTQYKEAFYGVAQFGGAKDFGTLFQFIPRVGAPGEGDFKVLAEFDPGNSSSINPISPLTSFNGWLYGIAGGGFNQQGQPIAGGTIYKINPSATTPKIEMVATVSSQVLSTNNGAGMIVYKGKLYGVISQGGSNGTGSIFSLDDKDTYSLLYSFDKTGLRIPTSLTVMDDGLLYGTFLSGSILANSGGVFTYDILNNKLTPYSSTYFQNDHAGSTVFEDSVYVPLSNVNILTGQGSMGIYKFHINFMKTASNGSAPVIGESKANMSLINARYFVGVSSDGLGGSLFKYDIATRKFLQTVNFKAANAEAPEFSTPNIFVPVVYRRNGKWVGGTPDETKTVVFEENYEITKDFKCYNLRIAKDIKVSVLGGTAEVQNDVINEGQLNVLDCPNVRYIVHGTKYGFQTTLLKPTITAFAGNTLPDAYLGEAYANVNFNVSYFSSPAWSVGGGTTLPAGITISSTGILSSTKVTGTAKLYAPSIVVTDQTSGCSLSKFYNLNVLHRTTWRNGAWTNGTPLSDGSSDVTIDDKYVVNSTSTSFKCNNLTVNLLKVLNIDNTFTIDVNGLLDNKGIINKACTSPFNPTNATGNQINDVQPIITPILTNLPTIKVGVKDSLEFRVNNITYNNWQWYLASPAIPPAGMQFEVDPVTNNFWLKGTPTNIGIDSLSITATYSVSQGSCLKNKVYALQIIDGISPNLRVQDVRATYGGGKVKVQTTTDNSDVPITYALESNTCATINATTGRITINCASPDSVISIYVSQAGDAAYKSGADTATLFIDKATPTLVSAVSFFNLGDSTVTIPYVTNSDGIATFQQFSNGGTDVATVSSSGVASLKATGTFTVFINLPETGNYYRKTIKKSYTVVKKSVAPIGLPDSITVSVNESDTINILENDFGGTGAILPQYTDIDLENVGTQSKFFSPSKGTFTIDAEGNLAFVPFDGFIGTSVIYYVIYDENLTKSEPIPVYVTVEVPSKVPELKATELITPNGDDLNEAFVIGNINFDKPNYLKVFDRNGNEVYYKENYENDWQGVLSNGDELDDGTFFFIFKEEDRESLRGTFQIKRQK